MKSFTCDKWINKRIRNFGDYKYIYRRTFSNNNNIEHKIQNKKGKRIKSLRGTADIFNQQLLERRAIVNQAADTVKKYGYAEVQTPTIEFTDVFTKSLGTTSDIISKEMFTWEDSRGRNVSLRPENTASIARAMISSGRIHNNANLPERVYYHGSMFRRERPQKGRLREFTQFGVESIGTLSTHEDIDVLSMAYDYLLNLGFYSRDIDVTDGGRLHEKEDAKTTLLINTLGDSSSRENYQKILQEYFNEHRNELSLDSQRRLNSNNVLRILDSKGKEDLDLVKDAPLFSESLTTYSKDRFDEVLNGLNVLQIPYIVDERLVRGLDYYNHTVFEFVKNESTNHYNVGADGVGQSGTLLAGGRYDTLYDTMGGPNVPAIGWAAGIERLHILLNEDVEDFEGTNTDINKKSVNFLYNFRKEDKENKVGIMLIPLLDKTMEKDSTKKDKILNSSLSTINQLRNTLNMNNRMENNRREYIIYRSRDLKDNIPSVKKSMKWANENHVKYVIFLGEDEVAQGKLKLKNMYNGEQSLLSINEIIDVVTV